MKELALSFLYLSLSLTDCVPAQFVIETVMENIAKALNKDPTEIRKINFYQKGQVIYGVFFYSKL